MKPVFGNFRIKPEGGLTKREFILVAILIIAIEGYLLFTYFVKPAYISYTAELSALESKQALLETLKAEYSQKAELDSEIEKIDGQLADIQKQIPSYLSQEEVILLVDGLSSKAGLNVQSISFQNASSLPLKANQADGISSGSEKSGAAPVPTVVEQNIAITFNGSYDQIYSFLKDIEGNLRKVAVKGITLQKNSGTELAGQMTLDFISCWDRSEGQKPFSMTTGPIQGKASLFEQYPGYQGSSELSGGDKQERITADFYLLINSYLNNSAKVVMMNYYKQGSEASMDTNGPVKASLVLEGGKDAYTYSYKVGSSSTVEKTATEVKNGRISLNVIVQPRQSEKDRISAVLDVTNRTDVPLEIRVTGDDNKNPRFILGRTTGNVSLK